MCMISFSGGGGWHNAIYPSISLDGMFVSVLLAHATSVSMGISTVYHTNCSHLLLVERTLCRFKASATSLVLSGPKLSQLSEVQKIPP